MHHVRVGFSSLWRRFQSSHFCECQSLSISVNPDLTPFLFFTSNSPCGVEWEPDRPGAVLRGLRLFRNSYFWRCRLQVKAPNAVRLLPRRRKVEGSGAASGTMWDPKIPSV